MLNRHISLNFNEFHEKDWKFVDEFNMKCSIKNFLPEIEIYSWNFTDDFEISEFSKIDSFSVILVEQKLVKNSVAFKIISIFRLIPIFMGMWNFRNFMFAKFILFTLGQGSRDRKIVASMIRILQVRLLGVCNESVRVADVKFLNFILQVCKNNYFRSKLWNSKNNTKSNRILKWTLDPSLGHF